MQNYIAHVRPIDPVIDDACHCYIGDRRYIVRRFTPQNVGVNTGPECKTTYGCYRIEYRHGWTEVRVTEPFRKALLAAAIPAFERADDEMADAMKLCG